MNKRRFNVSEARRRNRLKTIKKWASTLFFLFFILVGVAYGWNFVVRPKLAEKNFNKFLVSTGCEGEVVLEKMSQGFCLLSKRNLHLYENSGNQIKSFDFNLERPAVHCCGGLALVYDRNGKVCSLMTSEKILCNLCCEDNILLAKVAENGNFVVATQGDSFFTKFCVYDKTGRELFKKHFAENLIVDFDFIGSGTGCFVCTLGVSNEGFDRTTIYRFDFNQNQEVSKQEVADAVPVFLKAVGTRACLVCFNKLLLLDGSCAIVRYLNFKDDWTNFFVSNRGYSIFSFANSFTNRLVAYDKFANVLGEFELNEVVRKIKLVGNRVFILVDDKLIVCGLNLKILKTIELNKHADDFFCTDKYCYFLFGTRVDRIKLF